MGLFESLQVRIVHLCRLSSKILQAAKIQFRSLALSFWAKCIAKRRLLNLSLRMVLLDPILPFVLDQGKRQFVGLPATQSQPSS